MKDELKGFEIRSTAVREGLLGTKIRREKQLVLVTGGGEVLVRRSTLEAGGYDWNRVKARAHALAEKKGLYYRELPEE